MSETSVRFDVEQWLSGDQQTETIEIARDPEEDTCGFSPPVGTSLAVFFNDAGRNGFRSGLCGTADADLVRAALTPPAVDPNAGPGSLLIAESPAPTHLWLFDSVGRLAAVASPPEDFDRDRQLLFVEPCPGGKVIVEAWWGTPQVLVVRDLATMAPVRATTLSAERDGLQSIACLDETGDNLAASIFVLAK